MVNAVVPQKDVLPTAIAWGKTISSYSPTAIRFLKHSFNADTEHIVGIQNLAYDGLELFSKSSESHEGAVAFDEKRPPDFRPYR